MKKVELVLAAHEDSERLRRYTDLHENREVIVVGNAGEDRFRRIVEDFPGNQMQTIITGAVAHYLDTERKRSDNLNKAYRAVIIRRANELGCQEFIPETWLEEAVPVVSMSEKNEFSAPVRRGTRRSQPVPVPDRRITADMIRSDPSAYFARMQPWKCPPAEFAAARWRGNIEQEIWGEEFPSGHFAKDLVGIDTGSVVTPSAAVAQARRQFNWTLAYKVILLAIAMAAFIAIGKLV